MRPDVQTRPPAPGHIRPALEGVAVLISDAGGPRDLRPLRMDPVHAAYAEDLDA